MRLLAFLFFVPLLCLAEPATVIRATDLKKEPATDAATLATLAETTVVEAFERQGGWTRVKTQNADGWVRMLALRYGTPGAAKRGDSGFSKLFSSARTGSSGTQVLTTGVRGLDGDQIKTAQPNAAELQKLKGFSSTSASSAGFAKSGHLEAQSVAYPSP
jgi:Bacterial SH3 domain